MKFNKDLLCNCLTIVGGICVSGALWMLQKNTYDLHKRLKRIEDKNLEIEKKSK